ncbi:Sof1-like domain-containing protein [Mycena rebaudengoi]|nr:Sof1-like domain-containing protein [Mycena rebaudengoi]
MRPSADSIRSLWRRPLRTSDVSMVANLTAECNADACGYRDAHAYGRRHSCGTAGALGPDHAFDGGGGSDPGLQNKSSNNGTRGQGRGRVFSRAGRLLSSGVDKTVKLWSVEGAAASSSSSSSSSNTQSPQPVTVYTGKSPFNSIDHHNADPLFATASNVVQVWDETRSLPLSTLSFPTSAETITALRFNASETSVLASVGSDRTFALYDIRTGKAERRVVMQSPTLPTLTLLASEDHNLYTFDLRHLAAPTQVYKGHVAPTTSCDWAPTGLSFVSGGWIGRTIAVCDSFSPLLSVPVVHPRFVLAHSSPSFSPLSQHPVSQPSPSFRPSPSAPHSPRFFMFLLVPSYPLPRSLPQTRLLPLARTLPLPLLSLPPPPHSHPSPSVSAALFTSDARFVLSGSDGGNVRLWKANASARLGVVAARERAAIEYRATLKERWKMDKEVGRVVRSRHVPRAVHQASSLKRTMLDAQRVKEERRRKHTRTGTEKPKAERKKLVVVEQA